MEGGGGAIDPEILFPSESLRNGRQEAGLAGALGEHICVCTSSAAGKEVEEGGVGGVQGGPLGRRFKCILGASRVGPEGCQDVAQRGVGTQTHLLHLVLLIFLILLPMVHCPPSLLAALSAPQTSGLFTAFLSFVQVSQRSHIQSVSFSGSFQALHRGESSVHTTRPIMSEPFPLFQGKSPSVVDASLTPLVRLCWRREGQNPLA